MIAKLIRYMMILAAGISLVGCSDGIDAPEAVLVPDSPGTVTIRFSNSTATRSAESDNSETLIENLLIALYPKSADETLPAVAVRRFSDIAKHSSATVVMQLTDAMIESLFNNIDGEKCRMFAVANVPAEALSALPEYPSMSQLKALKVTSPFDGQQVQQSFVMAGEGEVSYAAPVGVATKGSASGNGKLYRAAAKLNLNISIPDNITIGEGDAAEVWEPEKSALQVLLNNGVKSSIAYPIAYYPADVAEESLNPYYDCKLSDRPATVRSFGVTESAAFPYQMNVPFYSYPNSWTESPEETHKTTLTLMVPWRKRGEPSWHTYYYQVPVTPSSLPHIDANYSYAINLTVGMLGSLIPETPEEVDDVTYQVVDWSQADINVQIKDFRYLVVNPSVYTVNNEAEIAIPFYSSHPVEVQDLTMTFQRFNFYSDGNGRVVDFTIPEEKLNLSTYTHNVEENGVVKQVTDTICSYSIERDPATNQLTLRIKHALEIWNPVNAQGQTVALTGRNGTGNNTLEAVTNSIARFTRPTTPETPYSEYTFNLTLKHKGEPDNTYYSQTISVTQYPGMYIEAKRNPGDGTNTDSGGNVYVNNGYTGNNNYLGSITTSLSGTNSNPNMYLITVSQLDNTSAYIIGDPRTNYYQNNLSTNNNADLTIPSANENPAGARQNNNGMTGSNWCQTSPALYPENGGDRTLTYYYPAIESQNDEYKMKVAPKFRVASSYGKTQPMNRNGARRRMATYQELNCPAGRWRLPTYGELQFIISLSNTGKIPVLYSSDTWYWSAQGACYVNSDGTIRLDTSHTQDVYCRGVYDEWYWEQYPQYTIEPTGTNYSYTLGDMPRGAQ